MSQANDTTPYLGVPAGLEGAVLVRVHRAQRGKARFHLLALGILALASLGGFIPAVGYLFSQIAQSGFGEYLGLVFSDTRVLTAYGSDLFWSLSDSLPVLALALTLLIVGIFVWSLYVALRNVRSALLSI